ncbi:DUF5063 domain-containing protein [uncultured Roseivirga sp.]|uniref:DUF5063 domain-containing protein n=1 Tax=uncultured Roseivirga sp. TaxID=543088 RepID=UPI0030DAC693|tara:strand:- start:5607 stop:6128 length:522 start_codon:yes stop_codon:yes gene_type:complete
MISERITTFLEKETTTNFLLAARDFIELLEREELEEEEFYSLVHTALIQLYSSGHSLEAIELELSISPNESDQFEVDGRNKNLISSLGQECFYWEVFDPTYEKEDEPTQGWLVDDFSDIYYELKSNLNKIDLIGTDQSIEGALWEMKFMFHHHWGNHCINAMRALHYLWYQGK